MIVLLYCRKIRPSLQSLQDRVERLAGNDKVEVYNRFQSLFDRLHQPKNGLSILVLIAEDTLDLSDFMSLAPILGEFRIILVLPDHDEKTIAMGHRIFPRFVTFRESDFSDIILVLEKMLNA